MRERGVIRTGNAPIGDYAEWLVAQTTGGELAPNSQKSWDVETPAGERLQVKSRFVTNPGDAGERQLSPFRSWTFDAVVIVLFSNDFGVWRAAKLPRETVRQGATFIKHVNGFRVTAMDGLLGQGEDWTERLREIADRAP